MSGKHSDAVAITPIRATRNRRGMAALTTCWETCAAGLNGHLMANRGTLGYFTLTAPTSPIRPRGPIAITPSGPLNQPGGRVGDRNPEYRDADEQHSGDAISITLVLQTMAGLKTRLL
jgi:hypothetical protein